MSHLVAFGCIAICEGWGGFDLHWRAVGGWRKCDAETRRHRGESWLRFAPARWSVALVVRYHLLKPCILEHFHAAGKMGYWVVVAVPAHVGLLNYRRWCAAGTTLAQR